MNQRESMMKIVFFDRGDTLEHDDTLLPGALELLDAVRQMKDLTGQPVAMGLISNFGKAANAGGIPVLRADYLDGLAPLGLLPFFQPTEKRVTISSDSLDVAFVKPQKMIFRAAVDKFSQGLSFSQALFVTEELLHVQAVHSYGMAAIHFKGPGQTTGEVAHLVDLVPLIQTGSTLKHRRFLKGIRA
jgi:FMN phosphatase YigB (HAD superfamily)